VTLKDPAGLVWFIRHRLLGQINRNPPQKQEIMAWEMNIALRTMSCIIKQVLGLGALKQ
jgi:hypothetical protein